MNFALSRFLIAGLVATSVLSVSAQAAGTIERLVEKSFTVTNPGTLHVETSGGSIKVEPSGDATVKVIARQRIKADSEAQADELLKNLQLTIAQSGGDVTAIAKVERVAKEDKKWFGLVSGWSTPVSVDFTVSMPAAMMSDLKTSGGNITIDSLTNSVRASTSGGGIRATIAGVLKEDSSLETSGGSIRVTVDKAAAFNLDASTSGGSVDADGLTITLKGEGRKNKSHLAGAVNGGGPALKLRTSGGGIDITTR